MRYRPARPTLRFSHTAHLRRGVGSAPLVLRTGLLTIAWGVLLLSAIILLTIFIGTGYLSAVKASLPDPGTLTERPLEQSTQIYDRNGKLLYTTFKDYNRQFVPLDKFPDQTKWAVLAAEDIDFYNHEGLDLPGILKSIYEAAIGKRVRGASTIDQQLIRNTVLYDELGQDAYDRTLNRKVRELLLSMELNRKLTKNQILELYLNEIPMGGPHYGLQAAAHAYFNKDIQDLTLAESAFLGGIIKAPSTFSPLAGGDEPAALGRRNEVLDQMWHYHDRVMITEYNKKTKKYTERQITYEDIQKAKATPLKFNYGKYTIQAPHFVFYVLQQLENAYGRDFIQQGGLRVTTSLDLDLQRKAEKVVRNNIKNFKVWYGTNNAAMVAIDPETGEILTMVGSVDYNNTKDKRVDGRVNVAISPRQMGSSVKPYTYLAAFLEGYHPASLAPDTPQVYGNYRPLDWDKRFYGQISIRYALNQSRNVSAVYMLNKLGGPDVFIAIAKKLGITTLQDRSRYGLSITLGAAEMTLLEHTNAYATFANEGVQHPATAILEIHDSSGNSIYKYDAKKSAKRVFDEKHIYQLNWVLCQMGSRKDKLNPQLYHVGSQLLCGKTGTTDGPKDLTSFLYYPKLVVGVWSGNNNGKVTFGTRGQGWSTNVPITIARQFIDQTYRDFGTAWYDQPSGVIWGLACVDTGLRATNDTKCRKEETVFVQGQIPLWDKR